MTTAAEADFDTVIVGAGVIGLACAAQLGARGMSVLVVERHDRFGVETSSRNSEVIHAGMYYPAGTLKAKMCVAGNRSLPAWCDKYRVRYERIGKIIVATSTDEEGELDKILKRAVANGVERLERVSQSWIAEREPNVVASAGLWSPNTGVVDSHGFMASLAAVAQDNDVQFAYHHRVVGIVRTDGVYELSIEDSRQERSSVRATRIVNAAGLGCDEIASFLGLDVDELGYRLSYVKGRYFKLRGRRVKRLIYPVPSPQLLGLGVHVTIDLGGGERLGPDTEVLERREQDYEVGEGRRSAFFSAASRYLRGLVEDDLSPDYSGIRPKLTPRDGSVPDFVVSEESGHGGPGFVNLIGIESPGLTCALEIAREVVTRLG